MSNIKFTNIGLVKHAEKALKEKWYYGWGAYGQKATTALVINLVSQYTDMNTPWKSYMQQAVNVGTRLCDCYGLVKSYLWWTDDNSNPKYNVAYDTNTAGAYNKAKEKGTLATLPEIPGIILYMSGHVGVYCGNGRFIELQGGGVGAYEGKITGGKITKGSKFTHWFKDVNIDYSEEECEVVEPIKIQIDGKEYQVNNIFKDDKNYVELQSLAQAGFKIGYNQGKKQPEIETPYPPEEMQIQIDGAVKTVERILRGDYNYILLRSLEQAGIKIDYDAKKNMPVMTLSKS